MPPPAPKQWAKNDRSSSAPPRAAVAAAGGGAEVPVGREGARHRLGVADRERGQVPLDHVARRDRPGPAGGLEDRRPEVPTLVDRPLAAVGTEDDRPVVGRLGHHRQRPRQLPALVVHPGQQLDHRPSGRLGGGDRLGPGVQAGQPGQIAADELADVPVAAVSGRPAGRRL